MKHFLTCDTLSNDDIMQLLQQAQQIADDPKAYQQAAAGKILALCFFESSTRTYFSFISAMQRLGGQVLGFSDSANTSTKKGESLTDSIKIMSAYADVMAVRHGQVGVMQEVAAASRIPVINAGEGTIEHPTQTLLDLLTIYREFQRLDINIALYGDLKFGRTNHSLLKTLARFGAKFYCIAPDELQMSPDYIKNCGAKVTCLSALNDDVLADIDVLYVTRLQTERLPKEIQAKNYQQQFLVDENTCKHMQKDAIIMHPLPRVTEIATAVDNDPRARYFQQAANGVPVRMALLLHTLSRTS